MTQLPPVYDRIRKIIDWTPKSGKLLDLGCDRGDITVRYKAKAKQVFGVDNNPDAIRDAKKLHKGVTFVLAQGEKLPFPDNTFDTVVMGDVLEHVEDEEQTVSEVYRVLKPDGNLVLSVPHKGLFRFLDSFNMKFYFPRTYKWWKGKKYNKKVYDIQPWHRHYSLAELKRLFGARFAVKRVHRGGLIAYPVAWILGDALSDLNRGAFLRKPMDLARHAEFQIGFGPLGYTIIVVAQCRKDF